MKKGPGARKWVRDREYIFPIGRFEERTELAGEKNNPKDFPFPSEARLRKVLWVIFLSSR